MSAWFDNGYLDLINYADFFLRLVAATLCGGLIGLEREKRYKNAGLRTHIIVAIASALMMMVSKYGFLDIVNHPELKLQADGSRVAASVVSAIGFLGAGVIFVKRESVVGLTTAAGLWATVGIGLALGAGFYVIGGFATFLILFVQGVLHRHHAMMHTQSAGILTCNITKHNVTAEGLKNALEAKEIAIKSVEMNKTADGDLNLSVTVLFKEGLSIMVVMDQVQDIDIIDTINIYPAF